MKLKDLLETSWNELDTEIFDNAKPNLDKALKNHKKLLKVLNPTKKKYTNSLKELEKSEFGQGQNYDEINNIKEKLDSINKQILDSEKEVKRLETLYYRLLQMVKK